MPRSERRADSYLLNPRQTIRLGATRFPIEYLYRGLLVTGAPGSGKTRCVLLPLLDEIIRASGSDPSAKAAMIVADPKNELAPFLQAMLRRHGREGDLIVLKPGAAYYNPLSNPFLHPSEMVEKLIAFGSNRNRGLRPARSEDTFWANASRALLTVTVHLAEALKPHGTLTFDNLNHALRTIGCFQSVPAAESFLKAKRISFPAPLFHALATYLNLPEHQTRPCVMAAVSNLLSFWEEDFLRELVTPCPLMDKVDPVQVIDEGKILVVGCASAADGASLTPLLLALKDHCFTAILSRDRLEIERGEDRRRINQERPVFFVADEFQAYLSPDPSVGEVNALDRMRGFKAGFLGATQNLASLHSVLGEAAHANRLVALFANQVFLANVCETTARQAEFVLGRRDVWAGHRAAPPLIGQARRKTEREEPFTGDILSRLATGEFWMRMADGRVARERASSVG